MTLCQKRLRLRSGFTFMELIIAVAILGLLVALAGPPLLRFLTGATKRTTEANVRALKLAIQSYYIDMRRYPDRLEELIRRPEGERGKKWSGPYLEEKGGELMIPLDGWDNDFQYRLNPGGASYQVFSWGPNGPGSPEDEWIKA